ncbi:TonB-dependent receptor [Bacteroidota bacterium]|nr:TonB-dependent receptor [Bacteroidota bacterium]
MAVMRVFMFLPLLFSSYIYSQGIDSLKKDSAIHVKYLQDITIVGRSSKMDIQLMPEIVGTSIYAGKKSSLIVMDNVMGNVISNNMRQVVAKVPGIQIWENDGSGIQIGIAARGLSPNRSWEFNVRQNGYDIAADPYGYPEAYYNPQLQAVQRIEIIRGHGALQYGPQFGGMVNYILRNGSEMTKKLQGESQQSLGSNGLFNTYNAIGGKTKKLHYYVFFDHRNANGYRNNSRFFTNAGFATITYKPSQRFEITAEYMQSHIRSQQAGGLLDKDFNKDIRKSYRSRNWMDIDWSTMALIAKWKPTSSTEFQLKLFGLNGDRNSVGFMPPAGILAADTINSISGQFNPRNLNTDQYRNYGAELRSLTNYVLMGNKHHFSSGIRMYNGNTRRLVADGKGSVAADYDMRVSDGFWTRDIQFISFNAAVFLENVFRIGKKYLLIPGLRYEYVEGAASGRNGFAGGAPVLLQNQNRSRGFLLSGIGAEYHAGKLVEIYGNISQAYRPVQFADLAAPPTTDIIDQQLKDSKGFNADLGFRGKYGDVFIFDASIYFLQYNNRIGTIVQQRQDGSFYNFRTNVGNSNSKGIEALVEYSFFRKQLYPKKWELRMFSSIALNDSRYGDFKVIAKNSSNQLVETNLRNKRVENAPHQIIRSGLTVGYRNITLTTRHSYASEAYSDANNTVRASANGNIGLIPSYAVWDLTMAWNHKQYNFKAGINNLTNEFYFTRRAGGYPGPGAMPADGRTFFMTAGVKI